MSEVATSELKNAVESQHGGTATFIQSVLVREVVRGEPVWDGTVHVFFLDGSPSGATQAYAWSHDLPDGKRRFFTMLHVPPVISPRDAVRAAIVAEGKAK